MDDTLNIIFGLLAAKEIEQKEFAKMIGVSEDTVSNWKVGRSKSYTKHLATIAHVLGCTANELLGQPAAKDSKGPGIQTDAEPKLTPEEARFIGYLRQMTPEQRKALNEKMEFLISMP